MNNEVLQFMKEKQMLKQGATVLVAVSGGPDSMALLHFYHLLQTAYDLKVIALSVDHQFRAEQSKGDLDYVVKQCEQWKIPCFTTSVNVPAYMEEHGLGAQVAAREVRYAFFETMMKEHEADYLALGHHADDQVETMLMAFSRSANPDTLAGIPYRRPFVKGELVRPFLSITKADIWNYCKQHGIEARIDPSNENTDYVRNDFRKHVVPFLYEKNNNLPKVAQHLSEALRADEELLKKEAKKVFEKEVSFHHGKREARLEKASFQSHPIALQRRAFHLVLECLYNHQLPDDLSYVHEEAFFRVLRVQGKNMQVDFPRRLVVESSYDELIFSFPEDVAAYDYELPVPGKIELPDGSMIYAEECERTDKEDSNHFHLSLPEASLPLRVRSRQPGDRMKWKGLAGSKKLKDIFIDEKIRRSKRDTWPIVTDQAGNIIWLVALRKSTSLVENDVKTKGICLTYERRNVQEDENA